MAKLTICLIIACTVVLACNAFSVDKNATKDGRFEYLGTLRGPSTDPGRDFDENNYYSSSFAGIWSNAIIDCRDTFGARGHLTSIETQEEGDAINKWLEDRGSGGSTFWTSGQYNIDDAGWIWAATGDEVVYTAWNVGQPGTGLNNRHRISLVHRNQFSAGWGSYLDSDVRRFICEIPATTQ